MGKQRSGGLLEGRKGTNKAGVAVPAPAEGRGWEEARCADGLGQ